MSLSDIQKHPDGHDVRAWVLATEAPTKSQNECATWRWYTNRTLSADVSVHDLRSPGGRSSEAGRLLPRMKEPRVRASSLGPRRCTGTPGDP